MLGVGSGGPLGPVRLGDGSAGPSRSAMGARALPAAMTPLGTKDGAGPARSHLEPATPAAPASSTDRADPGPAGRIGEREAWAVLASVDGIGPASFGSLVRRFGSAAAVLDRAAMGEAAMRDLPDDPDPTVSRRLRLDDETLARLAATAKAPGRLLDDVHRLGLAIVTLEDRAYPAALRATELAPPALFVLGPSDALGTRPCVSIVGTRRPTEAGRRVAARIAGAVARAGATVVSGLAVGIDGVAHGSAISEGGPTVAVLGAGHAHVTPVSHRALAARIVAEGGAIVSEFAPGARPTTWSFPRRNRIISGLSRATVVVEAAARSGALITAAWALEQGRECFLVPGSLDDEMARGCLRFLRDHAGLARVVAGIPELLEDLGLADGAVEASAQLPLDGLGEVARAVAHLVSSGCSTIDELAGATGMPAASVLGALSMLELRGLVVPVIGRYRPAGLLATRPPGGGEGSRGRRRR